LIVKDRDKLEGKTAALGRVEPEAVFTGRIVDTMAKKWYICDTNVL